MKIHKQLSDSILKRHMIAFSLCSILLLCPGCVVTQIAAYPPPDLPKKQVAVVESRVGVLKIDGETKSPKGYDYAKKVNFRLLPGEHTFLLCARSGNPVGVGWVYAGDPMMFMLMKVTLESGKKYSIWLEVNRQTSFLENLKGQFGGSVRLKITDAVMLNEKHETIASVVPALPLEPKPGKGNHK